MHYGVAMSDELAPEITPEVYNEDKYCRGLLIGEFSSNAYLIAKGVRQVAICHTYSIESPETFAYLAEYASRLSSSPGSIKISFKTFRAMQLNGEGRDIILWSEGNRPLAERVIELIQGTDRSESYHRELGVALGYNPDLIESFIASVPK